VTPRLRQVEAVAGRELWRASRVNFITLFPNGLAFSPDESWLYIGNYSRSHISAFDMAPNGTIAKQTDRIFADLRGPEPGGPDDIKWIQRAMFIARRAMLLAVVQPGYTSLIRRVKSSVVSFTAIRRPQYRVWWRRPENPLFHY
jgi:hypothetical protein